MGVPRSPDDPSRGAHTFAVKRSPRETRVIKGDVSGRRQRFGIRTTAPGIDTFPFCKLSPLSGAENHADKVRIVVIENPWVS